VVPKMMPSVVPLLVPTASQVLAVEQASTVSLAAA